MKALVFLLSVISVCLCFASFGCDAKPKPEPVSTIVKTTKLEGDWSLVEYNGQKWLWFDRTHRSCMVELK